MAKKKEEVVVVETKESTSRDNSGVNPAKARKEQAKKRARMRELEDLISDLEDRQSELEKMFTEGAGEDEYKEYGDNAAKLKDYYDEFFELGEELGG